MSSKSSGSSRFRRLLAALVSIFLMGVSVAFPVTALDVTVEIYYDATWNDITDYVFDRDGRTSITITRGRGNESARCDHGRADLSLNNADGRFSPRNPNSPLFGKIGRNTKLRIKVTENAVTYVRFVGEVTAWPARWDPSESDIWVPLQAYGILRRLQQGVSPLKSALHRTMSGLLPGDIAPSEYWPLEDGASARQFASAVGGLAGLGGVGPFGTQAPAPARHDGIPGSAESVLMPLDSFINMPVRPYTDTGQFVVQAAFVMDELDSTEFQIRLANGRLIVVGVAEIAAAQWLVVEVFDGDDVVYVDIGTSVSPPLVGEPLSLVVAVTDSGPGDDIVAKVLDGTGAVRAEHATTNIGYSTVTNIRIGGGDDGDFIGASHVTLFTNPTFDPDVDIIPGARAMSGWDGETARERVERLCREQGIAVEIIGEQSALMGPQRIETLLNLLEDCANTDRGFLYEQREDVGLGYRCNSSRFNQ